MVEEIRFLTALHYVHHVAELVLKVLLILRNKNIVFLYKNVFIWSSL